MSAAKYKLPLQPSRHFTWRETQVTQTGIDNSIESQATAERIMFTAQGMEKVRELLGNRPVIVTSWYRNPQVNAAVGGVPNSQHAKGEAVDFVSPAFGSPHKICTLLAANAEHLQFDQLILEPTWVHISFRQGSARKEVLTLFPSRGYVKGINR